MVPLESFWMLFITNILSPFYVFQLFSISFWYVDDYWQYSTASTLYQNRSNQQNLRDTIMSRETINRLGADLITILVPPALPAAMTIGIVLAN